MITTLSVLAICLAIVVVAQTLYIARQQATIDHLEDDFAEIMFIMLRHPSTHIIPLRTEETE